MEKKNRPFTGKPTIQGAYILQHGENIAANYARFEKSMYGICIEKYGELGKTIYSGVYPTQSPMPNGVDAAVRQELAKAKAAQLMKMEENKPAMFATIWNHLSTSSELAVRRQVVRDALSAATPGVSAVAPVSEQWDARMHTRSVTAAAAASASTTAGASSSTEAEGLAVPTAAPMVAPEDRSQDAIWQRFQLRTDPLELWRAIKRSHLAVHTEFVQGDRRAARERYSWTKMQHGETLESFKERFDAAISGMMAIGLAKMEDTDIACDFISKLDKGRYGDMQARFEQDAAIGIASFPENLEKAYYVASIFHPFSQARVSDNKAGTVLVAHAGDSGRKKKNKRRGKASNDGAAEATVLEAVKEASAKDAAPRRASRYICKLCNKEYHYIDECPLFSKAKEYVEKQVKVVALADDGDAVILDNGATASVFRSKELLTNIRTVPAVKFVGINGSIIVSKKGDYLPFGDVYFDENASANVLSYSELLEKKHLITLQDEGKTMVVNVNGKPYLFRCRNGLHVQQTLLATVHDNEANYTDREVAAAKQARLVIERMGYPGVKTMMQLINSGAVLEMPITTADVRRCYEIYGKSLAEIKGKTTQIRPVILDRDDLKMSQAIVNTVTLHLDVMYVEGAAFLVGVSEPMQVTLVEHTISKISTAYGEIIKRFIRKFNERGVANITLLSDGESALENATRSLVRVGIRAEVNGSGSHAPVVERKIRTIKERIRGILNTLPYDLPMTLLKYLVYFAVSRLNLLPNESGSSVSHLSSPREQLFGRKTNYKVDLRHAFGEYIQFSDNTAKSNSMASRTLGGIALHATGNQTGSIYIYSMLTKDIVERQTWKSVPITQNVIEVMNQLAKCKKTLRRDPTVRLGGDIIGDQQNDDIEVEQTVEEIGDMDQAHLIPEEAEPHVEAEQPYVTEDDAIQLERMPEQQEQQADVPDLAREEPAPAPQPEPTHCREGLRTNIKRPERYLHFIYNMTMKEAAAKNPDLTTSALNDEVDNLLQHGTFHPVVKSEVTKRIIPSKIFLKEKYLPSGEFDKMKARLVAGGHRQDRTVYNDNDTSSPTAPTWGVYALASMAASRGYDTRVVDIKSAYLNAAMPADRAVFVRLQPEVSAMICKKDKNYVSYLEKDGTIVVKLDRALYGCVESALLWYKNISQALEEYGMSKSNEEPCMFFNNLNGHRMWIAVHVDDLMVHAENAVDGDYLCEFLRRKYGQIKINQGKMLSYLGMNFEFDEGAVEITMKNYVDSLLMNHGESTARSPATAELFCVSESKQLSQSAREIFHGTVARLLYLSNRIRPDISTAVSFLCSRVSEPTEQDQKKLDRVMQYLQGTRLLPLRLRADPEPRVRLYVDASYAVHPKAHGHTGGYSTLGEGAYLWKSVKQKIVCRSSCESELVAQVELLCEAIHVRNFLLSMDLQAGPIELHSDSLSAMALAEKGRSGRNSRHIKARYFFTHDKIESNEVKMSYAPTDDLAADLMTKPLQGLKFQRFRDIILYKKVSD